VDRGWTTLVPVPSAVINRLPIGGLAAVAVASAAEDLADGVC
jgi:hypothetical protein